MLESETTEPPKDNQPDFPIVEVVCDHCKEWRIEGRIGPIEPEINYPLREYYGQIKAKYNINIDDELEFSWRGTPNKRSIITQLKTHHYTVRSGSQGHHQFTVKLDGKVVGIIRVST